MASDFFKGIVKSFLDPTALKAVILIFLSLFIFYNGALLLRIILKKFRKEGQKRKGIDLEPTSLWQKISSLFRASSRRVLEASIVANVILLLGVVVALSSYVAPMPKVAYPNEPSLGVTEVTNMKPVIVKFDRPISQKSLRFSISPEIKGEWSYGKEAGFAATSLLFTPSESLAAEERYTVSLENIKSLLGAKRENYLFSFQTSPSPKVVSVAPGDGDQGVLPGQEIVVMMDSDPKDTSEISFAVEPNVDLDVKNEGSKYMLKPKSSFKKGTTYNLKVFLTATKIDYVTNKKDATSEKQEIWNGNFKTVDAPGVESYVPQGSGVLASSSISINFRQDMASSATEKSFSITPSVAGTFSWGSARVFTFKPTTELAKNTTYAVKVSNAAKASDGSPFEEEFNSSFTTIGYVVASGFSPTGGSVSPSTKISVSFNQSVDHASAESKFSVSPGLGGTFSWSGNTLSYNHGGLSYSTKYVVSVAPGVKTVYGLDSNKDYLSSFTTKAQSVTLNVPSYKQSHMYSCMAAAVRQALAYRGVNVSEDTILGKIGYDTTPFSGTWGDPNSVWGDPNAGVTGNVDGASGGVSWGYGAHAGPTSRAISNYRSNEVKSGWSVQGIAQEIAAGNPVIVWWVNGVWPAYSVGWKTPSGTPVSGVNSMHVQVVKGFTGTVDNPTSFVVNDSGYGYPSRTFDVGTFKAKWSWFGNTAIVVR